MLSAAAGVTVFLVLLLFAVQVLTNLYATSAVTAAAYDAARAVASFPDGANRAAAAASAEERAREVLGRFGDRVTFEWDVTGDRFVVLHVRADNHTARFAGLPLDAVSTVDRTVRARVECFRGADGACRR